jgi:hypothetical protein
MAASSAPFRAATGMVEYCNIGMMGLKSENYTLLFHDHQAIFHSSLIPLFPF